MPGMAMEIAGVPTWARTYHRTGGFVLRLHVNRDGVLVVSSGSNVWDTEHHAPGAGNDAPWHVSKARPRFADYDRLLSAAAPASKPLSIAQPKIDDRSCLRAAERQLHLHP